MTAHDRTKRTPRPAPWLLALPVIAFGACSGDSANSSGDAAAIHVARRGPLRVTVQEAAELQAAVETEIKSEVEGRSTIIFLVEEGASVEQGQRIVELDVSDLEERRANQGITVERARANLVNAQQDDEILEKELAAADAEAESRLEIAEIDVEKFLGRRQKTPEPGVESGPTPPGAAADSGVDDPKKGTNADMLRSLREQVADTLYEKLTETAFVLLGDGNLEREVGELGENILQQIVDISLARQRLALAKDTLEHSIRLQEKDYITRNELDRDRLDYESQESQVRLAWQALDILISYTLRKTKIDLQLKLGNADLNLEKVKANASAKRLRSSAELASREKEYKLARERLENLDEQISKAVIRAPTPGLVVYASVDHRGREMVQEGIEVRERQTLLLLPDVTQMVAELKIQESDVDKVRVGQPAIVKVDALPGLVLTGRVQRVSPLADSGSRWSNNNLKVYKTWIALDGENEHQLRPNMSAEVEILVGEIADTLAIPLTAVRRQGRVHYVWKATGSGPVATPVEVGQSTVTQVEIVSGVEAGDRIHLAPPPGAVPPDLPQPPEPEFQDSPPPDDAGAPTAEEAAEPSAQNVTRQSLQAAVISAHPEFAERIESEGPRALFADPEIRAAIESDPKLDAMAKALREQMMQRMRDRGGEGAGEGRTPREGGRRGQ